MLSSLKRAIEVIELLAKCEDANGMSIRELSERLGIPAPSVHHCVKTFREQGWVTQDSSKRYKVSSRLWQLGAAAIRHRDIVSLARPAMLELLRESDETVYLGQKEDEQLKNIIYLERLDSPRAIQVRYEIGTRVPSYCSAIGKAILAHDPHCEDRVRGLDLIKYTKTTLATKARLLANLKLTRERGYSISEGEHSPDTIGVAAPIQDHTGESRIAVSVSIPAFRNNAERIDRIIPLVLRTSAAISLQLGAPHQGRARRK